MDELLGDQFENKMEEIQSHFQINSKSGLEINIHPSYSNKNHNINGIFQFNAMPTRYILAFISNQAIPIQIPTHNFFGKVSYSYLPLNSELSLISSEMLQLKLVTCPSPFLILSNDFIWNGKFSKDLAKIFSIQGKINIQQPFSNIHIKWKFNGKSFPLIPNASVTFGTNSRKFGISCDFIENKSLVPSNVSTGFSYDFTDKTTVASSFSFKPYPFTFLDLKSGFTFKKNDKTTFYGFAGYIPSSCEDEQESHLVPKGAIGWDTEIHKTKISSFFTSSLEVQSSFTRKLDKIGDMTIYSSMNHKSCVYTLGFTFYIPYDFGSSNNQEE